MPVECERLQGFPDGFTAIDGEKTPDGPRYRALGNSMAVPVMRWIGERIDAQERALAAGTGADDTPPRPCGPTLPLTGEGAAA